jgi:D-alanyl-D-alanine carboxypeptidase/D-alanyl-D-alanine-endopeptidase (penicillin-binding protein 4)
MVNSEQIIFSGCRALCTIVIIVVLLQPFCVYASPEARQFIDNGGFIVRDDTKLLKFREQDLFIPASTLKILTSLVALEKLGKDYRFETHFFLDEQNNLYIKGYGDPFLTSEAILAIGKKLAERGVRQINSLFLDESSFALKGEIAGDESSDNPYDAPNGALAVNFNALPVQVAGDTTISSGEPQTPLIALMTEAGSKLSPGMHRINVDTLTLPGQLSPALRYTGQLFIVQFEQAGINVHKGYSKKSVPKSLKPIFIHHSIKSLEDIIRACLKNSNNYIANQLFLACGVKDHGLPATWDKSRRTFSFFTENILQLGPDQITVKEGSGLSRQNRMSPTSLLAILDLFRPYSQLLKKKNNILLKSGTMKGVYCYAGYFPQGNKLRPFVILLNQAKNNRYQILKVLRAALQNQSTSQISQ